MEEENQTEKLSKFETIGLIRCLLYSNVETSCVLSEFLQDFQEEAGYPLPSFGEETPLDFLKSISWVVQVLEIEGSVYLKHVVWEDSDDWENFLAPEAELGENENVKEKDKEKETQRETEKEKGKEKKKEKVQLKTKEKVQVNENEKEKEKGKEKGKEKEKEKGKRKGKGNRKVGERERERDDSCSPSTSPDRSRSPEDNTQKTPWLRKKKKRKIRWNGTEHVYIWNSDDEKEYLQSIPEEQYGDEPICYRCETLENELMVESCIDKCLSTIVTDIKDIPLINFTDHVDVGDTIAVSVPEVIHPHKFFIHFKKFQTELTKLMGRMQTFYSLYNAKYSLYNFRFDKNMMCAAMHRTNPDRREWYRARIIDIDSESSKVLLIDYGLVADVSNRNLKYLDRCFNDLPVQAIMARLGNIKPKSDKHWSEESCKRLYSIVFERDLTARILSMNSEKRWLSVSLSYTDSDFSIDHTLVKEKTPGVDCEFFDDSHQRTFYDANGQDRFVRPEDIRRIQKLKSDFGDSGKVKFRKKILYQNRNTELKKMLGLELSEENAWISKPE